MFNLRDYQKEAIDALFNYFAVKSGNPLLVLPTSAGKSVINAKFIEMVMSQWPDQKIICLTHVKELIEQNHDKLRVIAPDVPCGVYSASLKRRDTLYPVTFAGIQSVYKKPWLFGYVNLIIVDEAHLLSPRAETMYQTFITGLKEYNPKLKVIGLTATPFRLKQGLLHEVDNGIFTDIAYEVPITRLLEKGHICPLISKSGVNQADLTGVKLTAGEYNQKQANDAINQNTLTEKALDEVWRFCGQRKSWLAFCSSVDHAHAVRDAIRFRGVTCEAVHGDLPIVERERILGDFKAGKLQCITNYGVLTTGFDAPMIDMIVLLRATQSAGLYIQMLGRGMRLNGSTMDESLANGKADCLVLDFCGNMERFGAINMIQIKNFSKKKKKEDQKAPCKVCPECRDIVPAGLAECDCGFVFPVNELEHDTVASTGDFIETGEPFSQEWDVSAISVRIHKREGKIPSLRIDFHSGVFKQASTWLCFEHEGYARTKAVEFWNDTAGTDAPETIEEAYKRRDEIIAPLKIKVNKNGKYWNFDKITLALF